jgi:hypothetical protein
MCYTHCIEVGVAMTSKNQTREKDRVKDRTNIGAVEFPIEKLMAFRDAEASCVHIEAAMEADRDLTDSGKKHRD